MNFDRRQGLVEHKVYDAIEDIADEIGLDVPFYPEVYWLGRNVQFEDLFLDEEHREEFDYLKEVGGDMYLSGPKIILIGRHSAGSISEESAHFLHFVNSGLSFSGRSGLDSIVASCLVEMLGFFGSKLVDPTRKNVFAGFSDLFDCSEEEKEIVRNKFVGCDLKSLLIYQQGYGLGEKMFDAYISGVFPIEEVRGLFLSGLKGENEALLKFVELKYGVLNFSNV